MRTVGYEPCCAPHLAVCFFEARSTNKHLSNQNSRHGRDQGGLVVESSFREHRGGELLSPADSSHKVWCCLRPNPVVVVGAEHTYFLSAFASFERSYGNTPGPKPLLEALHTRNLPPVSHI